MTHTKRHKKGKHQKIYNMKGCSKRKNMCKKGYTRRRGRASIGGDQPIPPYSMIHGGNCGACSAPLFKGGASDEPALIGKPWSVDNTSGNYLAPNLYNKGDPQTMMLLRGGKKSRRKTTSKSKRAKGIIGGGLLPSELVNFGRDIMYNVNSTYTTLNGYKPNPSPAPYEDQLTKSITQTRIVI
jgi:hypothetical protein